MGRFHCVAGWQHQRRQLATLVIVARDGGHLHRWSLANTRVVAAASRGTYIARPSATNAEALPAGDGAP